MESSFFSSKWTPAARDELARLVNKGKSAKEIARALSDQFGTSFSRNAIISKCHSTGLQLKQPCRGRPSTAVKDRGPIRGTPRAKTRRHLPAEDPLPPRPHPPGYRRDIAYVDEPTPAGDTPNGCRWLHSEDPNDRAFCGAEIHRSAYCQHHYARATVEPTPRQAELDRKRAKWLSRL